MPHCEAAAAAAARCRRCTCVYCVGLLLLRLLLLLLLLEAVLLLLLLLVQLRLRQLLQWMLQLLIDRHRHWGRYRLLLLLGSQKWSHRTASRMCVCQSRRGLDTIVQIHHIRWGLGQRWFLHVLTYLVVCMHLFSVFCRSVYHALADRLCVCVYIWCVYVSLIRGIHTMPGMQERIFGWMGSSSIWIWFWFWFLGYRF